MLSSGWRLRGARGGWPGILTIVTGVRWALWLIVATGLGIGRDPGVVPRREGRKSKASMSGSRVIFLQAAVNA